MIHIIHVFFMTVHMIVPFNPCLGPISIQNEAYLVFSMSIISNITATENSSASIKYNSKERKDPAGFQWGFSRESEGLTGLIS